jgi:hypothetical protein
LDAKEDAKERHIVIRDTARHISDEWRDALTAYRELKQSSWWLQLQHFLLLFRQTPRPAAAARLSRFHQSDEGGSLIP